MIKNYESIEDFKGNVTGNKIKVLKMYQGKNSIATVDENLCIGCKGVQIFAYTKVSILQMGRHPLIEIVMAVDSVRISL